MTVADLRKGLDNYPDDMEVLTWDNEAECGRNIMIAEAIDVWGSGNPVLIISEGWA